MNNNESTNVTASPSPPAPEHPLNTNTLIIIVAVAIVAIMTIAVFCTVKIYMDKVCGDWKRSEEAKEREKRRMRRLAEASTGGTATTTTGGTTAPDHHHYVHENRNDDHGAGGITMIPRDHELIQNVPGVMMVVVEGRPVVVCPNSNSNNTEQGHENDDELYEMRAPRVFGEE